MYVRWCREGVVSGRVLGNVCCVVWCGVRGDEGQCGSVRRRRIMETH